MYSLYDTWGFPCVFPHSEISGSLAMCAYPKLIAAYHVLHRLLMPRHSPCALYSLTSSEQISYHSLPCLHESSLTPSLLLSKSDPLRWAPAGPPRGGAAVEITGPANPLAVTRRFSLRPLYFGHWPLGRISPLQNL